MPTASKSLTTMYASANVVDDQNPENPSGTAKNPGQRGVLV